MLLGLSGFKGSGKNTVADYLTEKYKFKQLSFAAKLKESSAALFGIDPKLWDEWKNDPMKCVVLCDLENEDPIALVTVREFLKNYGTESHRDVFGQDFWVDQVLPPRRPDSFFVENTVVTDVRFPNEIKRVKDWGGKIWNVTREGFSGDSHASEQPIPEDMIDFSLMNDGSFDDLYKKIDEYLISVLLNCR